MSAQVEGLEREMGFLMIGRRDFLFTFADPALANWWIVRAADEKCLVIDIEPSYKAWVASRAEQAVAGLAVT